VIPADAGPLSAEELIGLESTLLPALERHHLRLLAHGLRTLQAIAGRCSGQPPGPEAIAAWGCRQPQLADDPGFQQVLAEQLATIAAQLVPIAATLDCDPLALSLDDLSQWAVQQADRRLGTSTDRPGG
jgi:hypothetical protein